MPRLTIDGRSVEVNDGVCILDAAGQAGIQIPSLCYRKELRPLTSCMLCVVREVKSGRSLPSCSAKCEDGMEIETNTEEIRASRKEILNLLLSEHVGDCEAPCRRICPASMDIPLMTRQISAGDFGAAVWTAKRELVLPATLGYVCPAPCEKGCRRALCDSTVTIRELHRHVAEDALDNESQATMCLPPTGKRVCIVGGGAAGLAAAWVLARRGHSCLVLEKRIAAGAILFERFGEKLPRQVLESEVESIRHLGVQIDVATEVGQSVSLEELRNDYDALILACDFPDADADGVFTATEHEMAVRAVASGKAAAEAADRFLAGSDGDGASKEFDSRIGKLHENELEEFLESNAQAAGEQGEMRNEASRCLHCDCRKPVSCRLRKYATEYGAVHNAYRNSERVHVELIGRTGRVVYEPGKCIKCGLCVEITKQAGEELGLTFIGRGFSTVVRVPFSRSIEDGLAKSGAECVEACPTGALSLRDNEER